MKKEYIMTYSTKTVKELQELRKTILKEMINADWKTEEVKEKELDAVCEELKIRSEQQKEKLKNLCESLGK